ncbi:MAG: response regulator [Candidatus Aminicenantes bacterium]|nr:response regulator [Candidatus Aminicenantes bacterium]
MGNNKNDFSFERYLFSTLMDHIPDAIYFKDRECRFIKINKAQADRFNLKDSNDAIGKTDFDFFDDEHVSQAFADENRIIKTKKPLVGLEEKETWPDGSVTWVSTTKMPLYNEQGELVGTFGISRDITDRKIAEEKLKVTLEQLKKANQIADRERRKADLANRAKSEFLARMSHEIRTPMNGVIGFTDMLLDTDLTEEQMDYVRTINRSGEALINLLNDILYFSKIEAGELTFDPIDFDPEITLFDICDLIAPRIITKPVEILCQISDDVPGFIKCDPGRFRQVITNLLGNAAKFTDEGEIEISMDVDAEKDDQIKLHTRVRDTGIGIPKNKQKSIFNAFQQVDGSTTRKYGGTGLGLTICRQIALKMNGDIWVESKTGEGSTFHFTCWVSKSKKKIQKEVSSKLLEGTRVLLVDDNPTNLDILTRQLENAKIRVKTVKDPKEAIPVIEDHYKRKEPFDICILDIQMPGMSGFDLCKKIRKLKDPLSRLLLLAFSSSTLSRSKRFREAGFNGYLPKPIRRKKLLSMLEYLLENKDKPLIEDQPPELLTQYRITEDTKHSINILLAEDNIINQKLAKSMLEKAGYIVTIANDGKEVCDIFLQNPKRFDLIFMDIKMPNRDGKQATKIIRQKGIKDIPIIAMTAAAMKGDREDCLQAGMDDYISKPIKREAVYSIVKKYCLEK